MHIRLKKLMRFSSLNKRAKGQRGQGLIETALLFPVILIVLSGLVEFGFLLNEYLALQDSVRNSARFQSDGMYFMRDNVSLPAPPPDPDDRETFDWLALDPVCANNGTQDFYRQAACLVAQELQQDRPQIVLDFTNGRDDIIVSAFSIAQEYCQIPATYPPNPRTFPNPGVSCVTRRHPTEYGEAGWSAAQDSTGNRNQSSRLTAEDINARLANQAPSTGLVVVEVFYDYDQKLDLPWVRAFLSDPVMLHNYTIMPLVSAEPTPTPPP